MIDTKNGKARLLEFVPDQTVPSASLLDLTGDRSKIVPPSEASGLQERVGEAWVLCLKDLTCGQCRVLVGQRFGLEWLAKPVAAFVTRFPKAECDLYPGDLSVASLIAWRDFVRYAPAEAEEMLATDFKWLVREAEEDEWEGSILKQAVAELRKARSQP